MTIKYNKFILFGDSITEFSNEQNGFALAPAIQNYYSRKLDVITRGYGGYNTDYGSLIFPEILKTEMTQGGDIKLMTIFMGTNDAAYTNQHVPVDRYKKNLDKMVTLAISFGIKPIIVGPTLHDQGTLRTVRINNNEPADIPFSSSEETKKYSKIAEEVALERGVAFVDLWNAFQRESGLTENEIYSGADLSKLLIDGIHFTLHGYEIMYKEVIEAIKSHYPELDAVKLETILPVWNDLNQKDFDTLIYRSIS